MSKSLWKVFGQIHYLQGAANLGQSLIDACNDLVLLIYLGLRHGSSIGALLLEYNLKGIA